MTATLIDPHVYQALVIRKALELYVKTGMKVNRAYTPSAMLYKASQITGRTFKSRDYKAAITALSKWIEARQAE